MTETERKIVEAAIHTFVRYGARKTAMADIASEAGVSRQTLYATFGGKDELIVASIRFITDRNLQAVRDRLEGCDSLSAQLDAYFGGTVVKSFELLQTSGDAEDLVSGHNEAGRGEIERSHEKHQALVAELLAPYSGALADTGQTLDTLTNFIVTVVMGLKYSAKSRGDLDALLAALKTLVLTLLGAAVREPTRPSDSGGHGVNPPLVPETPSSR